MSILESNITEEEKLSGYKPNESGNESFMLEQLDSYPGILPDFSYEEPPLIPNESPFEDNDEEFDDVNDFEDDQIENQDNLDEADEALVANYFNNDTNEDIIDDNALKETSDEIENINLDELDLDNISDLDDDESSNASDNDDSSGAFEDSDDDVFSGFEDDQAEFDESKFNFEHDGNNDGIEELTADEIRELEGGLDDSDDNFNFQEEDELDSYNQGTDANETNDTIELDDDFKNLLAKDLKKSKERKGDNFNYDDDIEVVSDDEFPIDDDISVDVMNFSEIDADKPSNFGIDKIEGEKENDIKDEKNNKKDDKKLSKRMIYIYSGVAVTLLMALLITAILNKDNIFGDSQLNSDSTLVENIDNQEKPDTKNDDSKQALKSITKSTKNKDFNNQSTLRDSTNITSENKSLTKDSIYSTDITINNSNNDNSEKVNLLDTANQTYKNDKVDIKSETINPKTNKSDIVQDEKVSKNKSKTITNKKDNKKTTNLEDNRIKNDKIKSLDNVKKDNIKDIVKSESNSKFQENNKNLNVPYPKKEKSDEGLFIVQIYASQSKEDAMFWLNKLKKQEINDAFISEQIVRDEVWYRVRFGNFTTKTEALETASKLGYAQTWVDRVK